MIKPWKLKKKKFKKKRNAYARRLDFVSVGETVNKVRKKKRSLPLKSLDH